MGVWIALQTAPQAQGSLEAQLQLNEQGYEASAQGDHEKAARLFRASLDLGELNITYLNLGRSLSKLGRCQEAIKAYNNVEKAPPVEAPSPAQIQEVLTKFRADLTEGCPAEVTVVCKPATMTIQVDDQKPQLCPAKPLLLAPGKHRIVGLLDERRTEEISLTTKSLDTLSVALELKPVITDNVEPPSTRETIVVTPGPLAGWIMLGVGGVALTTVMVIDLLVLQPRIHHLEDLSEQDDRQAFQDAINRDKDGIESFQNLNLGLLIGGGVLTVGGAIWLAFTSGAETQSTPRQEKKASRTSSQGDWNLWWNAQGGGLQWQRSW